MSKQPTTIVEAFWQRLERTETTPALRFLHSGEVDGPTTQWDFLALHQRAARIAAALEARGLSHQPVLLVYPPGVDFLAAFVGCLYANVIAVPVYPPSPVDLPLALGRIFSIGADCGARVALTTADLQGMALGMAASIPALASYTWIATDSEEAPAAAWAPRPVSAQDIAFLQYTSGSTGEPKGVVVRHDNLWFNVQAAERAYPAAVMVSWLPSYHDMGLIGSMLTTMALGQTLVLLPPHEFLRRPTRWMRAVSHFRADRTVGPNFGYMLAAQRSQAADLEGLDLSALQHAVVGAEPVSPRMLRAFVDTFGPCGFAARAFAPAFGMAEATLLVTTRAAPRAPTVRSFSEEALAQGEARPLYPVADPARGRELVGCGVSIPGQRILIADPATLAPLPAGATGEILVSGPSVAREYWGRPASREEVFQCAVPGQAERFLRTGDLGFVHEGELFVSGRIKDLIIIRGKNHVPADIEATLERELPQQLRPGRVVAAPLVVDGEEALLVLAEGTEDAPDAALLQQIARLVAAHHGVSVHTVALLEKGALPKTSSGKLRRRAARDAFQQGSLVVRLRASFPAEGPALVYRDVTELRERLDRRGTAYRFDLERDIPWDALDLPGVYLPRELLAGLGIDVASLEARPQAYALFQWAAALSTCRTFELLEWGIIQFCRRERAALGDSRSIDNLCVEEEKHIQAFRRYAAHLERQRPELVAPFEAAFRESFTFLRDLFDPASGQRFHLQIWLDALLFEPYSLYLAHTLATAQETIQPAWLRLHELHAREEGHHVVTVSQYATALAIADDERAQVSERFLAQVRRGFEHLLGTMAPNRLVRERWPELRLRSYGPDEIPPAFLQVLGTARHFAPLRRAIPALAPGAAADAGASRPDLVLVLSSERAGSTLLRIMLSGHAGLFSPPELNLLSFGTLEERARRLPAAQQDGLVQAWIDLYGESRGAAGERLARAGDASTLAVYEDLVQALDGRVLVDKSPLYSRDLQALQRAEAHFGSRIRYVFLTRHPYAVVDSYARIGLQRLLADEIQLGRDAHELGEMGWTLSNRTVLSFLSGVDPARCARVRFEDLVSDPRGQMTRLLSFLGIPWSDAVLDPYRNGRMVADTGPAALVGDPNFAARSRIDPQLGDAWKTLRLPRPLGAEARRVAAELGYPVDDQDHRGPQPPQAPGDLAEVRARVTRVLAQATQRPESALGDDTTIASLGLSSLELIRLTDVLERAVARPLHAMTLYDHPTLGALVAHLAGHAPAPAQRSSASFGAELDLRAEVRLDEALRAAPQAPRSTGGAALLTGVTGFLGAFLLQRLLVDTDDAVHCLVRAEGPEEAQARVRENLARYGIWEERFAARIIVERGDLAQPLLGVGERRFDELAERVGVIYHNGALLRFDQPYEALRAANVDGTRDIIRLATQGALKPLHHVSTVSVFDAAVHSGATVDERAALSAWEGLRLGYAQSKWVSERVVALAAERGVPVTIYRPAGIAGHSQSGAWNTGDLVCRILKGCLLLRAAPRLALEVDMAPVDYVSRALVWLSRRAGAAGGVYHLNHPRPISWSQLIAWMRFRGYPLEEIAYSDWLTRLHEEARGADHPLRPLLPFLSLRLPPDGLTLFEARQRRPSVSCAATASALSEAGIVCPALGHELLSTWFHFLAREGFFPEP